MAIKMKTVVTYRATAACPTHARTEIPVRDLTVVIDEPTERGGTNLGPSPTETAMAALIGCTNVIGHKNAHRLGIDLGEVTIKADCQFDRRGVLMQEEIDLPGGFGHAIEFVKSKQRPAFGLHEMRKDGLACGG